MLFRIKAMFGSNLGTLQSIAKNLSLSLLKNFIFASIIDIDCTDERRCSWIAAVHCCGWMLFNFKTVPGRRCLTSFLINDKRIQLQILQSIDIHRWKISFVGNAILQSSHEGNVLLQSITESSIIPPFRNRYHQFPR